MIIIMETGARSEQTQRVIDFLENNGFKVRYNIGEVHTVIDALGDKTTITPGRIAAFDGVKEVKLIREPFRLASRDRKNEDTVIEFENGVKIGGNNKPVVIAGPCSVEDSYDALLEVANAVKESGGQFLRGGAFKPRTSPYDFQGYEEKALKYLKNASEATGLLTVSEIMDATELPLMMDYIDVLQIGARNMQNFKLLKAVGQCNKPVILKRGLASTIREFLLAAEHIMYNGNNKVILCERGIRSFDSDFTRNVMDIASIPVIRKYSHLPIIVDPSHGTGQRYLIEPMAKAGLVVGASGVMIEVHNDPENALSDGKQSLPIPMFKDVMGRLNKFMENIENM
ncbi:MAG: 3-deoxy-7-phosphoheptulonate synthase [Candidatus Gastranaerophilaceae bacterium]|nr:3-deoxy-7-phosphoheptulonate synthase [Candidatus Gastranaerophilaceae bacterium]